MTEIKLNELSLPEELTKFIGNAKIYLNSGCSGAQTVYIEKDDGYFLKINKKNSLKREQSMAECFAGLGLSPRVLAYLCEVKDYLLSQAAKGKDALEQNYLDNPKKLCEVYATSLRMLHETDFSSCPVKDRMAELLADFEVKYLAKASLHDSTAEYFGVSDIEEVYTKILSLKKHLKIDVLLHGDYCLPNIILNDFKFSSFIDVGCGGIGDRHYDLFWGIWSLQHNLKTESYTERFLDAYGRELVDKDRLTLCGLISTLAE